MNEHSSHPNPDLLDQLRAGLFDAELETRQDLETHLQACESCRKKMQGWDRIGKLLRSKDEDELAQRLHRFRSQLDTQEVRPQYRISGSTAAIAAGLVLAVSLGLAQFWDTDVTQEEQFAQQKETVPAVHEDLEFYIWLAGHEETALPESLYTANKT